MVVAPSVNTADLHSSARRNSYLYVFDYQTKNGDYQQTTCPRDLSHTELLKCLREKPLELLLSTPVVAPEFTTAFGPSIDGVIIDTGLSETRPANNKDSHSYDYHTQNSPGRPPPPPSASENINEAIAAGGYGNAVLSNAIAKKAMVSKLTRYDLLLGVVKAEAFFTFTGDDIQYGIEPDRRSKILRTFVKNTYRYHLSEILATIINEYTDWERPVQHPVNIRDETLEALSDAMVVAPSVNTADLHSSARRNSYLYVFDYQTKNGDYQQVRKSGVNITLLSLSYWALHYLLSVSRKTYVNVKYCAGVLQS
ncbi:uncharacterized protein LOC113466515 [Diaphorina citri]|uniref:Uncharacterized protein LOC113466515 n=1 Tax=Diaphorina citri TaxID=121845 RepID=A0A3Q0INJ2_DIACI|nr:uncharacterized protein LOC113466515 [Diaphorina citri]